MAGRLKILRAGPSCTIQDGGRTGYLRFGVTPAGPMDWIAFRTANLALGNDANAAAIEISPGGMDLVVEEAAVTVAFAGAEFQWKRNDVPLPPAALLTLQAGERISARTGPWGAWTYLAVAGGLDTPVVMGSRATHTRSQIGGFGGAMLKDGDVLGIAARGHRNETHPAGDFAIIAPWLGRHIGPFRVLPGPQDDYFDEAGLSVFFNGDYALTTMADRMAYRFEGPKVPHAKGFNIVSDGVALGAIQIPGEGHPFILMADRQPTGGYPKIGHVIRVDIARLSQTRIGEKVRFVAVSAAEARKSLLALEDEIRTVSEHLRPMFSEATTQSLLSVNLISGVVDALSALSPPPPGAGD